MHNPSPDRTPALFPISEAARMLGVGMSTTKKLIASGKLRSVRIARRRLVPADEIEAFVEQLKRTASAR